jgi:5-methylcytosine-specific restriction protein B
VEENFENTEYVKIADTMRKTEPFPLNQILYGPPGTGKTYHTINEAVRIANPDFDINQEREKIKEEYDRLKKEGFIEFVTFHQSFSYEDFVEGIKPKMEEDEQGKLEYEIKDGVFKRLCNLANIENQDSTVSQLKRLEGQKIGKNKVAEITDAIVRIEKPRGGNLLIPIDIIKDLYRYINDKQINFSVEKEINLSPEDREKYSNLEPYIINGYKNIFPDLLDFIVQIKEKVQNFKDNKLNNHVLIIDEINRGNIASIFGELITLIEDDKRTGSKEALSTTLPYSKKEFSVPCNVYIIGTMNTADRSIEALDIALRRRFTFKEIPPVPELFMELKVGEVNLTELLHTINKRIKKLIDKDHTIGHAYFMNVHNENDLKQVFTNKIIPLLEEYFFNDYAKIGLVLGNSFVEMEDNSFRFANFQHIDPVDYNDLKERKIYKIKDQREWDFCSII